MGPFELQLSQFAEETMGEGGNADQAVRAVVLEVGSRIVVRSPVDTGRFRSNWHYSLNSPVISTTAKTGGSEVANLDALPVRMIGHVHYIQNNLPYGPRLEHGWSKQAPAGMVGLTVREFSGIVDQAAKKVNP